MSFNYPNFNPEPGNLTYQIQTDYITSKIRDKTLPLDSLDNKKITSLIASNNPRDPIFFWQLYSVLGESPIHTLIFVFYENIFNDNDKWFSEEFIELGSLEYHVKGQKRFWLDIMGGGEKYINGMNRLNLRHSLVENIMTLEGANKWLYNMNKALNDPRVYLTEDCRVIYCINDFLNYFMNKYSNKFNFHNNYNIIQFKSKF
tara:strand:+ start:3868 stop:4473 length:606 start_codon:yes stop_codon:yes gene_type:complete